MPREIDVFGLLMPTLVPLFVVSLLVLWQADKFMHRKRIYEKVALPAFFRLLIFSIIFCAFGLLVY